eukprot:TRINITY_DN70_c0_g1_i11.p1 TRINITY_DN70_c0_g1~~TRINITY_DN70_c0_g1_i11.p1  ORF type:complete len:113 (+),score=5.93 TRINITY_DN70_c0_g1_i11:190-528(+)
MKVLFKKIIFDPHDDKDNDILSIDNSDLSYLSIRTSQVFVIFKYALLFLFMLNKLNPSDGKKSKFLSTTPTYPKFASTYKRCHFMITCSYCGLAGHNTPVCPLKRIFILDDI